MTHHARAGRATLSIEPIPRHLGLRWSSRLRTVTVGNTSPSGGDRPAGSRRPPDVICQTQTPPQEPAPRSQCHSSESGPLTTPAAIRSVSRSRWPRHTPRDASLGVTVGSVSANHVRTYINSAIFAGVSRSTTRKSVSVMGSRSRPPDETAPRAWRRSDLDLFHH